MKKLGLLVISLFVTPFLLNCNNNTYHFKFIGNNCKINGKANFDANIVKNESNIQYIITPDEGYKLAYLDDAYQDNFTLEGETLTILEMKQDYTITVNAIDKNIAVTVNVDINPNTSYKVLFKYGEEDRIDEIDWGDNTKDTEGKHTYTEDGLYSIVIRGFLTSIKFAFAKNAKNIIRANIYSKNITLQSSAFAGCINLVSVNLPNDITLCGSTFSGCTSLKSIKLPENLTHMYGSDFQGCTGLTSIVIPEGVLLMGSGTFRDCTNLASINIPNNLISIGDECFQNCAALTSIAIHNNITSIGSGAFDGCVNLASINIPTNPDFMCINDDFCKGTGIASIKIPNNIYEIQSAAFANCPNLVLADLSEVDHVIEGADIFGLPTLIREDFRIKVKANLVDDYKTAMGWDNYANFIVSA